MKKKFRTSNQENGALQNNNPLIRSIVMFLGIILLGTLVGTITLWSMPSNKIIMHDILNHGFIITDASIGIHEIFIKGFRSTAILTAVLFILGFCAVSQPIEIFALFYRGFALGISISYTYYSFGLNGIWISLLIILPHAILTSIIMILAVRESIKSSNIFAAYAVGKNNDESRKPEIKLYIIKFSVLFLLLLVSAIIYCLLFSFFKNFAL